jgi:hypothetical protein
MTADFAPFTLLASNAEVEGQNSFEWTQISRYLHVFSHAGGNRGF